MIARRDLEHGLADGPSHSGHTYRLCVRIAGLSFLVRSIDPELRLGLDPVREAFRADDSRPDVDVSAHFVDQAPDADGTLLFDSGSTWRLYRTRSGFAYRCAVSATATTAYKLAFFDAAFRRGTIHLDRNFYGADTVVSPLDYPVDELLVNQLLARGNGAEIHACGIDAGGRGYLFVGHSGAGKSTTARLWQQRGARVLSDDRIVLRARDERVYLHGTPWHGEAHLADSGCAPLKAIFFLQQARHNRVTPLSRPAAVARLLATAFPPFYDADAIDFTVKFLAAVATDVPCHELAFRPDPGAIQCVLEAVAQREATM